MKVYIIDNEGQWTHREYRVLRELGVEVEIKSNKTPLDEIKDSDALIFSGGSPRISLEKRIGKLSDYLGLDIPILGICIGCQYIAVHFGGKAGKAAVPEYGKTKITIDNQDPIFKGLPREFTAWESHNDEIKELPSELEGLAHSENCIQAIRHRKRPIYGLQFHPEVNDTEYGHEIFKNFLEIVKS